MSVAVSRIPRQPDPIGLASANTEDTDKRYEALFSCPVMNEAPAASLSNCLDMIQEDLEQLESTEAAPPTKAATTTTTVPGLRRGTLKQVQGAQFKDAGRSTALDEEDNCEDMFLISSDEELSDEEQDSDSDVEVVSSEDEDDDVGDEEPEGQDVVDLVEEERRKKRGKMAAVTPMKNSIRNYLKGGRNKAAMQVEATPHDPDEKEELERIARLEETEGKGFVVDDEEEDDDEEEEDELDRAERELEEKRRAESRARREKRKLSALYTDTKRAKKMKTEVKPIPRPEASSKPSPVEVQRKVEQAMNLPERSRQTTLPTTTTTAPVKKYDVAQAKRECAALFQQTLSDEQLREQIFPEEAPPAFKRMLYDLALQIARGSKQCEMKSENYVAKSYDCAVFYMHAIWACLNHITSKKFLQQKDARILQIVEKLQSERQAIRTIVDEETNTVTLTPYNKNVAAKVGTLPCPSELENYFSVCWFLFSYPSHMTKTFSSLYDKYKSSPSRMKRNYPAEVVAEKLVVSKLVIDEWTAYRNTLRLQYWGGQ